MKISLLAIGIVLLFGVIILSGQTVKLTPEQTSQAKAAAALRFNYAASKDYSPYDSEVAVAKKKCSALMREKAFAAAIVEADRGLLRDKYNIDLLIAKAAAWRALGNTEKAEEARQLWRSLMDSILASGDGRDFATAWRVISVDEEYAVLKVMQAVLISQSLVRHDGSQFDVLTVKDPDSGTESQLHFNVDLPMGWLDAKLAPARGVKESGAQTSPPATPAAATPGAPTSGTKPP